MIRSALLSAGVCCVSVGTSLGAGISTLVTGLTSPRVQAVENGEVYYSAGRTINKVAASGGSATTLFSGLGSATYGAGTFQIVGNNIVGGLASYSSEPVYIGPKTGGSATVLTTVDYGGSYLGVIGTDVYFGWHWQGGIRKVPLAGGSPTQVLNGSDWTRGNAIQGTSIYYSDYTTKSLIRFDTSTSTRQAIYNNGGNEVAVYANDDYFFQINPAGEIRRWSHGTSPGAGTVLLGSGASPLAADDDYIYFTQNPERTNVYRLSESGGTPELLFAAENAIDSFVTGQDQFFFTHAAGAAGTHEVLVYVVPEPASLGIVAGAGLVARRRTRRC